MSGNRAVLGGQSNELQAAIQRLPFALIFGLAVADIVLAAQSDSFPNAVTVSTVLPLSVAGAAVAQGALGGGFYFHPCSTFITLSFSSRARAPVSASV